MSEEGQSRYRPALESTELVSMAEATLGSLSQKELDIFTVGLRSKTAKLLSIVKDREELTDGDFNSFFGSFLSARRHSKEIISGNSIEHLNAALKSLRVSSIEPNVSIQRFSSLNGAPAGALEDVAMESIHFLNPDRFGLCTRWVFNPENGKGALSGAVRGEVPSGFTARQTLLQEARRVLDAAGYSTHGFYGLDIMCSLAYAGGIMGAKDSSMNSGGMEALFPNSTVLAAMILGIRREILAHT